MVYINMWSLFYFFLFRKKFFHCKPVLGSYTYTQNGLLLYSGANLMSLSLDWNWASWFLVFLFTIHSIDTYIFYSPTYCLYILPVQTVFRTKTVFKINTSKCTIRLMYKMNFISEIPRKPTLNQIIGTKSNHSQVIINYSAVIFSQCKATLNKLKQ